MTMAFGGEAFAEELVELGLAGGSNDGELAAGAGRRRSPASEELRAAKTADGQR